MLFLIPYYMEVEKTNTQVSGGTQADPPKEKEVEAAEGTQEVGQENSKEKSPEELLAELSGTPEPRETASEEDEEPPIPEEPKGESEDEPIEGSLGEFLEKEETVTINKVSKHPDIQDGDIDKDDDGKSIIRAQHVYDEIESIFGSDKKEAKLEGFFKLNNAKPKKANEIAKICGFTSRHKLAAAIEEYKEAKTVEDQNAILADQFPEWVWTKDVATPFSVDITSEEKGSVVHGKKLPWTKTELNQAIDSYVADNEISKESITKSAKLMTLLEDNSTLSRGGKPLSADEVLKMVVPVANITPKKLSPNKQVSLGGQHVQQVKSSSKKTVNPELLGMAKQMGLNTDDFEKHLNN